LRVTTARSTATVTFLFTDVEGSTRLLERFPELAGDALARHHDLVEAAVNEHGGRVFERIGDAAYAAFDDALPAVEAAVALQRVLVSTSWGEMPRLRVRLALLSGEVEERDGRYFGPPLFRAARLQSLAMGGETLLSATTVDALGGQLPDGARLRDLGEQRLKDLAEPEHVFQLVHTARDGTTSRHGTASPATDPEASVKSGAREEEEIVSDESAPIRVMLVDDHTVVRRGLRGFLELLRDMEVVGEAENGSQAVAAADRLQPDVILMDLLMPEMDGLTAIARIKADHPEIEIVAVTSFIEEEKVTSALEAGASGYLLKDAEADEVASAIRAAYAGEVHLDPAVARMLAQRIRNKRSGDEPVEELTAREKEVLAQLGKGASNKEIAYALSITERTARTHVSNILGKLGLASRTQAALWAVEHKLIDPAAG
jgi:DNA-binding NarL/FixJ family response regulator/class 3 adenylate cyclase